MGFWRDFCSADNSMVHSPYVIAAFVVILLATPIVLLSMAILIFNAFWLRHPLDSPMTQLLLGLLTAVTGTLASALFARTTSTFMSSSTVSGLGLGLPEGSSAPPSPAKQAPPMEVN